MTPSLDLEVYLVLGLASPYFNISGPGLMILSSLNPTNEIYWLQINRRNSLHANKNNSVHILFL